MRADSLGFKWHHDVVLTSHQPCFTLRGQLLLCRVQTLANNSQFLWFVKEKWKLPSASLVIYFLICVRHTIHMNPYRQTKIDLFGGVVSVAFTLVVTFKSIETQLRNPIMLVRRSILPGEISPLRSLQFKTGHCFVCACICVDGWVGALSCLCLSFLMTQSRDKIEFSRWSGHHCLSPNLCYEHTHSFILIIL